MIKRKMSNLSKRLPFSQIDSARSKSRVLQGMVLMSVDMGLRLG